MYRNLSEIKINLEKVKKYGFYYDEDKKIYIYTKKILDDKMTFKIYLEYLKKIKIDSKVIDNATGDEYILYKIDSVNGSFVAKVREESNKILKDFFRSCFDEKIKNRQKKDILDYIKEKYGSEAEYLWEKSPETFVVRRKDNQKWFGVFITVGRDKLGMDSKEKIDILNLKLLPAEIKELLSKNGYYPAYHMNKDNWLSILLNDMLTTEEIIEKIDKSYELMGTKKKSKF